MDPDSSDLSPCKRQTEERRGRWGHRSQPRPWPPANCSLCSRAPTPDALHVEERKSPSRERDPGPPPRTAREVPLGLWPRSHPGELNAKKDRVSGKEAPGRRAPGLGEPPGPSRRLQDSSQTAGPFLGRKALPPCWHPWGLQRKPPVYSLFGLVALEIFNSLKEDVAPGPELTGSLSPREGLLLHIPLPFEAHPRGGSFPQGAQGRPSPESALP